MSQPQMVDEAASRTAALDIDVPDMYVGKNVGAVHEWLCDYPELLAPLRIGAREASRFFKEGYHLELEVMESPEASEGNELVATIRVAGPWQDARRQFDRFEKEWWEDQAPLWWGRLTFLLGFLN